MIAALCGCGGDTRSDPGAGDAAVVFGDAAVVLDDAGVAPSCLRSAALRVYPRKGSADDTTGAPHGPGLVLMGGGRDVEGAFTWMHDTLAGDANASGGDVVIVRESGSDALDEVVALAGRFGSVQTLVLAAHATACDLETVASAIDHAEAVFFPGGDQHSYLAWRGSRIVDAVANLYARGGVVGGTSAGCDILTGLLYDHATPGDPATRDAVANPFEPSISVARGMFSFPHLDTVLCEPHVDARDRMGRMTVFMARALGDGLAAGGRPLGLAISEGQSIVVDRNGLGTLVSASAGRPGAFFVSGGAVDRLTRGAPIRYTSLSVIRLDRDGQTYDFARGCGTGTAYSLTVDGERPGAPYSPVDPYRSPGIGATCP